MPISRRNFVAASLGAGAAVLATPRANAKQPDSASAAGSPFSPITPDADARAVVGASHRDLDAVRELVAKRPSLALSTIDHGFGDWESALGAASHVGRPDIAEFLIAHGARPDLFTFAMMGNLAAVKAAIEAAPGTHKIKGPHSLTLASHARAGGDAATEVLAYLLTLDGSDDAPLREAVDNPALIMGAYTLLAGATGRFEVAENRRGLEFRMDGFSNRDLMHQGSLEFHTPGSPHVRFKFSPGASPTDRCRVLIELGDRTVEGERQA